MKRIAIFGSAFNPPTLGHEDVIKFLLDHNENYEQILLLPSIAHAFGKSMLNVSIRVRMLAAMISELDDDRLIISRIEERLADAHTPVYTFDVLEYLQSNVFKDANLTFVIGPDNQRNWHKFYRADEIRQRWTVLTAPERLAVRSSMVREHCQNHRSLDGLVTSSVAQIITTEQLYQLNPVD